MAELDYAKTLGIFFMVIIHTIEEMSFFDTVETEPSGFFQNFTEFCAGPLAAPAFMFAMGACTVFSPKNTPRFMARRGLNLWVLAMLLNLVRDVIPDLIMCLINGVSPDPDNIFFLAFNVDILHFSAICFFLTALLKKLRMPVWCFIPTAVVMQITGNMLSVIPAENKIAECIVSYFYPAGELAFFPLLNCYIWMAVGITAGEMIIRIKDTDKVCRTAIPVCAVLLAGYLFALNDAGYDIRSFYTLYDDLYYTQTFLHFIFNTLIIIIELSVFHFIHKKTKHIYGFCRFCSANLNTVYIVQWLLIGWISTNKRYGNISFSFETCAVIGFFITLISIGITKLLPKVNLSNLSRSKQCV